jgi:hypothetical protein
VPGELGNPEMQMGVGYYDRRYRPTGEWMLDEYGLMPAMEKWRKDRERKGMIDRVLDKCRSTSEAEDAREEPE